MSREFSENVDAIMSSSTPEELDAIFDSMSIKELQDLARISFKLSTLCVMCLMTRKEKENA